MPEEKKKLLLHTCCAPCATGCLDTLADREVILFYSNSNIGTEEEYSLRLEYVERLAEIEHLELIVDPYNHADWLMAVSVVPNFQGMPEHGARCPACFEYSLGRTARKAQELGITFSTTLTVSPYKSSRTIFGICVKYPHFEAYDFKKNDGYLKSLKRSQELGFYRQKFCGCEFSFRETELRRTAAQTPLKKVF